MLHALMLAANGDREQAVSILDRVTHDTPAMTWTKLASAMACALRGQRAEVVRIMNPDLRAAAMWDDIFSWWSADCLALVDERDAAMDFVERAVAFGFINYPFLAEYEPFLASVRREPRFVQLMQQVQPAWAAFEP